MAQVSGSCRGLRLRAALVSLVLASCSCGPSEHESTDASADTGIDAPHVSTTSMLDLLLVVETGNSGSLFQPALARELPWLLTDLASGDIDRDGVPEGVGVSSIHLGIVSGDLGLGSVSLELCDEWGDDGVLRTMGSSDPSCLPAPASGLFTFQATTDDPVEVAREATCVLYNSSGCGAQQHFEAALKAISPDGETPVSWTRPGWIAPIFRDETRGHGGPGGANDGFVREDSVLAILVMSNEDDCSTPDTSLFDIRNPRYAELDLIERCMMLPEELYPVSRYADGLLGLRRDSSRLVFAAIGGMPQEIERLGFDEILALPAMAIRPDQAPACSGSPAGLGLPARRFVTLARDLEAGGARATVSSICNDGYRGAIEEMAADIIAAANGVR